MQAEPVSYPPTRRSGTVILSQNSDDGRRPIVVILDADHVRRALPPKSYPAPQAGIRMPRRSKDALS